ncbi:MAG: YHYH protein [Alphaproteobacteria bacterium]|nr:YHYH protein [Alphaproteobacteria bacterium]
MVCNLKSLRGGLPAISAPLLSVGLILLVIALPMMILPMMILPVLAHESGVGAQPIGDGKISRGPQRGYLFSCQSQFPPNGPGANRLGPWAANGLWQPDEKIAVQGSVNWPNAAISLSIEGGQRLVRANGLPKHATGQFPIDRKDPAFAYDRNPNMIRAQDVVLRLPVDPKPAAQPVCASMGMIGFALSGVAIFNALDARGRDAAVWEILDRCGGHPERTGEYHYHDFSPCLQDSAGKAGRHSDLVGYALDGYGFYGPHGEAGQRLTNADLDACHGHAHQLMKDGRMQLAYHYHFTDEYPYSLGCFTGVPVAGGRAPGPNRPPPR